MRIGLAYNEKPDRSTTDEPPGTSDAFAEWDDPSTIAAVEEALGLFGSVTRLEADEFFPQKLALAHPDLVFNMAEGLHGQNRESLVPAFTVAILGNGPQAYCFPIVGFDFAALPRGAPPVYGYEAKWVWDTPEHPLAIFQCPAPVAPELYREIERTALDAYFVLGCRDWCRVDIRVDRFGVPNVLE